MLFLALTVLVALVGGLWPAIVSAVVGFLLLNWFFTLPTGKLTIAEPENALALGVFVLVAAGVASVVDLAARRTTEAFRARAEASALAADLPVGPVGRGHGRRAGRPAARDVHARGGLAAREARRRVGGPGDGRHRPRARPRGRPGGARGRRRAGARAHRSGAPRERPPGAGGVRVPGRHRAGAGAAACPGRAGAHPRRRPTPPAPRCSPPSRTTCARPLATIRASVDGLTSTDLDLDDADRAALVGTLEESTARLERLIDNLLDLSRLQTGSVRPVLRATSLDEIVPFAIEGYPPGAVVLDVPDDLPLVHTDPGLLERVVANLVSNAVRHARTGSPVVVGAGGRRRRRRRPGRRRRSRRPRRRQGAHVRRVPAAGRHHRHGPRASGWPSPTGSRPPSAPS